MVAGDFRRASTSFNDVFLEKAAHAIGSCLATRTIPMERRREIPARGLVCQVIAGLGNLKDEHALNFGQMSSQFLRVVGIVLGALHDNFLHFI